MAWFVLSLCHFDISVGIGAFVIGLGQISSFLSKILVNCKCIWSIWFQTNIKNPTRVSSTKSTLIYHIYTNKPDDVCEINVPCISWSDHYPVCATRKLQQNNCRTKPLEIEYKDFKNINDNAFLQDLSDSDIWRVTETNDPNEALSEFYESFWGTQDKHAKVKLTLSLPTSPIGDVIADCQRRRSATWTPLLNPI